jgi:hypothetical protein
MKKVYLIMLGIMAGLAGMAQTDTTGKKNPSPESSDTIRVGSIIIVKKGGEYRNDEGNQYPYYKRSYRKERVSTNWLILDLGISNYNDRTDYGSTEAQTFVRNNNGNPPANKGDFRLKTRLSNVNIWLFMQRMSVYKNVVNLKYGFGLEMNNYYFKSNIRYKDDPATDPNVYVLRDAADFSKDKLAADYITVPFMLNFNTNPGSHSGGLSVSFGVSAGYLYSSRNKLKSHEFGKEKVKSDFNLDHWKLAYIGELGLGPVKLYGSYAMNPMHEFGVKQYPYNVGVRFSSW